MKAKVLRILLLSVVAVSTATAQTVKPSSSDSDEIFGTGTEHFLARFKGPHQIADSNVFQTSNGNVGIGTTAPDSTVRVFNTRNSLNKDGVGVPEPYAVYATLSKSTIDFSSAIRGDALGTKGGVFGVIGLTYSRDGAGVDGGALDPDGKGYGVVGSLAATSGPGGGGGVLGTTQLTTGFSSGVRGEARGSSGGSVAIFGQNYSPDGSAGLFINRANGALLVGAVGASATNVFRVDGNGTVFADGGFQPNGADFAESVAVTGDRSRYIAGDLLVIDPTSNRRLTLAQQPYSTMVAGIYSTKPGMLGSTRRMDEAAPKDEIPLAVVGIVPCRVTTENGPIQAGDLLVASSTLGHAMKGTDRSKMLGAVVGKALEPMASGEGIIQVLVTLQ